MRMIQGITPRLKDPLRFDEIGERDVILRVMVHLYNFHTAVIGIKQIMNLFTEKNPYFCNRQNRLQIKCYQL